MSNVFEEVSEKIKNSSIVIWVFIASVGMLIIGINHFVEDTLSSYYGIKMLEKTLGMIPASYDFTYWTMSLAPQMGQIVFGYIFISNTKNRWAAWSGLGCFWIDFFSDTWYRSNQGMFHSPQIFFTTFLLTFFFFTIGSEGFITIGIGMVLELFPGFIIQFRTFFRELLDAFSGLQKGGQKGGNGPMRGNPFRQDE